MISDRSCHHFYAQYASSSQRLWVACGCAVCDWDFWNHVKLYQTAHAFYEAFIIQDKCPYFQYCHDIITVYTERHYTCMISKSLVSRPLELLVVHITSIGLQSIDGFTTTTLFLQYLWSAHKDLSVTIVMMWLSIAPYYHTLNERYFSFAMVCNACAPQTQLCPFEHSFLDWQGYTAEWHYNWEKSVFTISNWNLANVWWLHWLNLLTPSWIQLSDKTLSHWQR